MNTIRDLLTTLILKDSLSEILMAEPNSLTFAHAKFI